MLTCIGITYFGFVDFASLLTIFLKNTLSVYPQVSTVQGFLCARMTIELCIFQPVKSTAQVYYGKRHQDYGEQGVQGATQLYMWP